jgi:serine/threonine protein kinase
MNDGGQPAGLLADSGGDAEISMLERVHSGPRHRLYRDRRSDPPVVVKLNAAATASASAVASLRHEFEILHPLELPGIVRALGLVDTARGLALAMEDAGDSNLAQRLGLAPLSIETFLNIALQLAEAVARLHHARIVHRDIHPGNIVWSAQRRTATLCDLAIARTVSSLAVETPDPNQLEGTLAYMSPEQTGRTGRAVDGRADLYSLGATFYEMLTGAPPFAERDAVALAHAQIARRARGPHEINPSVPLALSRIVLRLLEKEPERRYQTAEALAADLREAKQRWLRSESIEPFPLASHEVPRGLSIPDKLYGRDQELQSLSDAFARTCAGGRQ